MKEFAEWLSLLIMSMVGTSVLLLVITTGSAIILRPVIREHQELLFNLLRVPEPAVIADKLILVASELVQMEEAALLHSIGTHDVKLLMASMSLLGLEVLGNDNSVVHFVSRISSSSLAGPKIKVNPDQPSRQPHIANEHVAARKEKEEEKEEEEKGEEELVAV